MPHARPVESAGSVPVVMGRAVLQQRVVVGRGVLVDLVARHIGQRVTEHLVEPPTQVRRHPFGLFAHAHILPKCHHVRMASADKVKIVVDNALRKVGEYSEKASDRATGLAEEAAKKAGELTEVAREKAPGYLDRAAELACKAADATADGVDKVTGGRYHDKIDSVHDKVDETLHRVRHAPPPHSATDADGTTTEPDPTATTATPGPTPTAAPGPTTAPSGTTTTSGGTTSPSAGSTPPTGGATATPNPTSSGGHDLRGKADDVQR